MIKVASHIITACVLSIIILAHNINTLVIIGDFILNQDFISKTLCIQKDNQQGCNGKCHLKTELAKNETGTNRQTPIQNSVKRHTLDVFCVSEVNIIISGINLKKAKKQTIFTYTPKLTNESLAVAIPPPDFS